MTNPAQNQIDSLLELSRLSADRTEQIAPDEDSVLGVVTRDDESWQAVSLEQYLPSPRRDRGDTVLDDPLDFAAELVRRGDPTVTTVFVDRKRYRVTAVLNDLDGEHGGIDWRDYRLTLQLALSPEWQKWTQLDGKLLTQVSFAELIEDGLSQIVSPPAADMLEVAQSFEAKRSADFESGTRLSSGDVSFRYTETTQAKAGQKGDLEVPAAFVLRLPVFEGGALVELKARLRYRISNTGLQIGYKLDRPDELQRAAVEAVAQDVTAALAEHEGDWRVVAGAAPAELRPIA